MKEIILVKDGELALKGLNRSTFEDILVKNMRRRLSPLGKFAFTKSQSTVMIEPLEEGIDLDEAAGRLTRVFGIAGFSRAAQAPKEMGGILRIAGEYLAPQLMEAASFKVEAKRSDKKFPLKSPQISAELGGYLGEKFPHLHVDVHHPDVIVTVEVRDQWAYIRGNQQKGAGGMPVGSGGRVALLVSGGIDSPVAGWMMAKRGLQLTAVHFASPPYTSPRAEEKVHALLRRVARYAGHISLFVVPFTEIQEQIKDHCPEDLFTLIMRRAMMLLAERIARKEECGALVTGESIGQVASQTLQAIACTDAVAEMPVFRPLIAMDKDEIVALSRRIDTFEISIQPYEDCCTVFTPKHPKTRPQLDAVEKALALIPLEELMERALAGVKIVPIDA